MERVAVWAGMDTEKEASGTHSPTGAGREKSERATASHTAERAGDGAEMSAYVRDDRRTETDEGRGGRGRGGARKNEFR